MMEINKQNILSFFLGAGGGGHIRWVERGVGVNILEDARHCSALYICKYFVSGSMCPSIVINK